MMNKFESFQKKVDFLLGGKIILSRGLSLWKKCKLEVGGEGQDTSRHFEGGFGSMRAILPM